MGKIKQSTPIDEAEASKVLTKYISEIIEKGLDNVKDSGGDLQRQVELVNKIVSIISYMTGEKIEDTLSVDEHAEQLLALIDKQSALHLCMMKRIKFNL